MVHLSQLEAQRWVKICSLPQLCLPRQPVTPDGPRDSPTLPGWSPSLGI